MFSVSKVEGQRNEDSYQFASKGVWALSDGASVSFDSATWSQMEANEWEEQFFLGYDEDQQIDYGLGAKSEREFRARLQDQIKKTGYRETARLSGVSRRTIGRLMEGEAVRSRVVRKIIIALRQAS